MSILRKVLSIFGVEDSFGGGRGGGGRGGGGGFRRGGGVVYGGAVVPVGVYDCIDPTDPTCYPLAQSYVIAGERPDQKQDTASAGGSKKKHRRHKRHGHTHGTHTPVGSLVHGDDGSNEPGYNDTISGAMFGEEDDDSSGGGDSGGKGGGKGTSLTPTDQTIDLPDDLTLPEPVYDAVATDTVGMIFDPDAGMTANDPDWDPTVASGRVGTRRHPPIGTGADWGFEQDFMGGTADMGGAPVMGFERKKFG